MSRLGNGIGNDDKALEQGLVQLRCRRSQHLFTKFSSPAHNERPIFSSSGNPTTYDTIVGDIAFTMSGDPGNESTSASGLRRSSELNVMTVLNGVTLDGVDATSMSEEEIRLVLNSRIRVIGVVRHGDHQNDKAVPIDSLFEVAIAGISRTPAQVDMPHMQRIEAVAATPSEYAAGKLDATKTGRGAERVPLLVRPSNKDGVATSWATAVKFYLRDPAKFAKAMNPLLKSTRAWICGANAAYDFALLAMVVGLERLQFSGAMPFWPHGDDKRPMRNGIYRRENNLATHMFWSQVGLVNGAVYNEQQVANAVFDLARRFSDDNTALPNALAVALGFLKDLSMGAPLAFPVDDETAAHYGGRTQLVFGEQPKTFSIRQTLLRAIYLDEQDRRSMFGTKANGQNNGLVAQKNTPVESSVTGRIIKQQLQGMNRLGAALADAFYNQQEHNMGVTSRPSQTGKYFHLYRSGFTG